MVNFVKKKENTLVLTDFAGKLMSGLVFFLEFLWLIWRYIADTFWNFLIPWLLNYLSQCTLTLPVPSQWEPEKPIVLAAFITENLEIYCLLFIRKTNFVTCWAWMVYGQGKNKWKMRGCIDSRAWFCMRQINCCFSFLKFWLLPSKIQYPSLIYFAALVPLIT